MKEERILLAHGSGGKLSAELIRSVFVPAFGNPALTRLDDSAVVELSGRHARGSTRVAISTDCHVVKPLFFEGGDIGRLSICGTVNDLAMVGARALYIAAGFVLEEGLPLATLREVVASMKAAAEEAGVAVVTGDTKVVEQGSADGMFVTTTGVGLVAEGVDISGGNARPGDLVLLSGPIGDHGIAVLSRREGLEFDAPVASDVAPLNHLVAAMLEASPRIRCLRDPTRGGLATTLNELAAQSGVSIRIDEARIPVRSEVAGACEMLGLDPLYIANEGKLIAVVSAQDAERVLAAMRADPYGCRAAIIGEVTDEHRGRVVMKTSLGTSRIVDMLTGEALPRIC